MSDQIVELLQNKHFLDRDNASLNKKDQQLVRLEAPRQGCRRYPCVYGPRGNRGI
jgi:hypothetical protein